MCKHRGFIHIDTRLVPVLVFWKHSNMTYTTMLLSISLWYKYNTYIHTYQKNTELLLPVLLHLSASLCCHSLGMHFLSCSYFRSNCYKPVGNQLPQNIFRTRLREVTPWACSRSGLNLCQSETSCQPHPRKPTGNRLSHQSQPHPLLAMHQERGTESILHCHVTSPRQNNNNGPILKLGQLLSDKSRCRTIRDRLQKIYLKT